jgi:hypothetical protein
LLHAIGDAIESCGALRDRRSAPRSRGRVRGIDRELDILP